MSYSKKHGGKSRKPPCYGDPDEWDPDDRDCKKCRFGRTCRITVRRKLREEEEDEDERPSGKSKYRKDSNRPNAMAVTPDPEEYEERDDEIGFWPALVANGAMSAARAGLVEATFALDQIPRFPYPDPFDTAIRRGRGKRIAADDDEDMEE